MAGDFAVLAFGGRRPAGPLAALPCFQLDGPASIDEAVCGRKRVVVLGDDAELAAVLTRLMRADLLAVEVAQVRGFGGSRRALRGSAQRVPLIRDDTGTALVGSALWLPPGQAATIHGEAVVDDTVLFDGDAAGVRIEPTTTMPGLRAQVLDGRRRRWISGRAVQLGTGGARVVRDGVEGPRVVKRSTFYRHTTGWLRV
ncbi:MAG: peptidase M50 [Mycobacterium sp.]|nr:peptidase M50 [Mycobacterium sp.]